MYWDSFAHSIHVIYHCGFICSWSSCVSSSRSIRNERCQERFCPRRVVLTPTSWLLYVPEWEYELLPDRCQLRNTGGRLANLCGDDRTKFTPKGRKPVLCISARSDLSVPEGSISRNIENNFQLTKPWMGTLLWLLRGRELGSFSRPSGIVSGAYFYIWIYMKILYILLLYLSPCMVSEFLGTQDRDRRKGIVCEINRLGAEMSRTNNP